MAYYRTLPRLNGSPKERQSYKKQEGNQILAAMFQKVRALKNVS
jgi:hypothetical protein